MKNPAREKKKKSPGYNPVIFSLFEFSPRKGDLKKIEILEAALEIIASKGVESVSNESIAKRLKTRRSHVAYYFDSKAQIIEMAMRYAYARGQAVTASVIRPKNNPHDRLVGMVDAGFEWAIHNPDLVGVTLAVYSYCTFDRRYRDLMATIRNAGLDHMMIHAGGILAEAKISAAPLEVRQFCKLIQGLTFGAIFEYYATAPEPEAAGLKELKKRVMKATEVLIREFLAERRS